MTASQMEVTFDPQDQWSMGTMGDCDGNLAEEKGHRRKSERDLTLGFLLPSAQCFLRKSHHNKPLGHSANDSLHAASFSST